MTCFVRQYYLCTTSRIFFLKRVFLTCEYHFNPSYNRPRSIYQYSNMALRLSGQTSIFGVVSFVSKSLMGIEGQKKLDKFAILTRKPQNHAWILIYRMWPIRLDIWKPVHDWYNSRAPELLEQNHIHVEIDSHATPFLWSTWYRVRVRSMAPVRTSHTIKSCSPCLQPVCLWYWTSILWSTDTFQNKVSTDQYHVTISQAQI